MKPPLRSKSLGTKITESEYAQLEALASARGQTLSEWVRSVLLQQIGAPNGHGSSADGRWPGSALGTDPIMIGLSKKWCPGSRDFRDLGLSNSSRGQVVSRTAARGYNR